MAFLILFFAEVLGQFCWDALANWHDKDLPLHLCSVSPCKMFHCVYVYHFQVLLSFIFLKSTKCKTVFV